MGRIQRTNTEVGTSTSCKIREQILPLRVGGGRDLVVGAVNGNWAAWQELTWGGRQVVPATGTEAGCSGEETPQLPSHPVLQPAPDTGHPEGQPE